MAPKPKTDKTKAAKKIQKAVKAKQKKKNEAAIKIQRGIQGTAKLIVDETVEAMDGKVKEVKVKSSFMGKKVDNLEYVMFKAYQLAKKKYMQKKIIMMCMARQVSKQTLHRELKNSTCKVKSSIKKKKLT